MKNTSLSHRFRSIINGIARFHLTIFFVLLASGLVFYVLTLNKILDSSSKSDGYTSALDSTSLDQTTITQLAMYHTSNDPTLNLALPAGRVDPFDE